MKKTDVLFLSVGGIVILALWLTYLTKKVWLAIPLSIGIWSGITVSVVHLLNRRNRKKEMTVTETEESLALLTKEEIIEKMIAIFPPACNARSIGDYVVYEDAGKKKMLAPLFKFGVTSGDDIARINRTATSENVSEVTIAGRLPSRQVILLTEKLRISFTFMGSREVRKTLIKHNLMPQPLRQKEKGRKSFKEWRDRGKRSLGNIFIKKRARLFLLSGVSLALLSILSPLRIYYVAMATLSFVFMAICLINDYRKN